jgi:O-antigen/teichoic acid export membrane protein
MLGGFAGWLLKLSDRFLIEALATSKDLGVYSAAYGLADQSVGVIIQLFQLPFVVMGNQIWEREGSKAAAEFLRAVSRFFLMAAIPAAVGISVLSKPMMTVMTGPEYLIGYRIMPWVASATLVYGLSQWFAAAFMFAKRMTFNTIGIVAGGVVNVGLNLVLIPRYGYEAAAVTSLLGFVVVLLVVVPRSRKIFMWRFPIKSLARISLASAVMGVAITVMRGVTQLSAVMDLVVGVPLGVMVVAAMLVVLKELSPRELAAFRAMRQRGQ